MVSARRQSQVWQYALIGAVAITTAAAVTSGAPQRLNLSRAESPLGLQTFTLDRSVLGNLKSSEGASRTAVSRNFALVTEISIGTPAQKLRCLIDSGSSDLWVPSKRCASCGTERVFQADASKTFKPEMRQSPYSGQLEPRAVKISYGSGEIVGYSVVDTVAFGPTEVEEQSFLIVEDAELPPRRGWDGICGLGWKGLTKLDKPLYERLQGQGLKGTFAFVPGKLGQSPYMTVGSMPEEETMEPGTLVWAQAESGEQFGFPHGERGFWIVPGGVAITRKDPVPARFLIDTGTNQVLLAPAKHYSDFMRSLLPPQTFDRLCGRDPRAGNLVVCDCSVGDQADLPPLRIYLGERAFVLPIKDLFREAEASDGGNLCVLQIQPNSMGPGAVPDMGSILGPLLGGLLGPPAMSGGMGGGEMDGGPHAGQGGMGGKGAADGETLGALLGALFGPNVEVRPVGGAANRRLQYGPMPMEDPTEDLWMIGGVFLERYVTIFDFDEGRVGFAEPAGGPVSLRPSTLVDASLPQSLAAGTMRSVGSFAALLAAAAGCVTLIGIARRVPPRTHLDEFQRSGLGEAHGEEEEAMAGEMPLLGGPAV